MTIILDESRLCINSREIKVSAIFPPMKDGTTHLVEVTSDPADHHKPKLQIAELRGLLGGMLPSGFELIMYGPESRTLGLDFLSFQNLSKGRRICFSVRVYFEDWSYRTNLIHFAEDLRSMIEQEVANCQSIQVAKDEYGITLSCAFLLEVGDDCCDVFMSIDRNISQLYKKALANADKGFSKKLETAPTMADEGIRWWIRYVVVPIVSGGAGAALVGWLVLHL